VVGVVRRARAFAPGHVTGIFRPSTSARDPRGRGSVGAGVALELGVHAVAQFRPGGPARFRLTSDLGRPLRISEEAGRRLIGDVKGKVTVHLTHDLPVGQGFGTSAAGATATALAVARVVGRSRGEAIEVSHLADFFGGGGLGGVAAILGGGLEVRTRPGIPPWGRIVHRPFLRPFLVGVVGKPIPSPRVLSDPRAAERIVKASEGLDRLGFRPSIESFFELSERFTDLAGLAPASVHTVVLALRRRGAWAAQAMFGRSFFALPRTPSARRAVVHWLERQGIRGVEVRASRTGARIVPTSADSPEGGAFFG
jgi:pantoate kinase